MIPINITSPILRSPYDFWEDDHPAISSVSRVYSEEFFRTYTEELLRGIQEPFFLYYASPFSHTPLEAPDEMLEKVPKEWDEDRRIYTAMCGSWDMSLKVLTDIVKERGVWDNTLLIFTTDNGGPVYWSFNESFPHPGGANNWPLKGEDTNCGW